MITILHTIDTNEPGGAETVFIDLATRLPENQYKSITVICDKGWIYDELQKRGVEPVLVNTQGSFNWRYLKSLVSIIRREKVDLIQSHLFGSNIYCSLAGLITGTPVVAVFHGAVDIAHKERFLAVKVKLINRGASRIIAVSDSLRRNIVDQAKLSDRKTEVIYNGTVTANYTPGQSSDFRRRFGWSDDDVVIGSIGNIHSAKGYDVLLKAAAVLNNNQVSYRFVIAGDDKSGLYDTLLKQRSELGMDEVVQFLGFYDDPARFMRNIDLFLLPSISEGFSIVTIEAMAANKPVIATRCGGPEEIITHGTNGLMIEPGSVDDIVSAVETLSADRVLRETLASKGREHALQTFDMQAMLDQYQLVYRKLLNKS